MLNLLHLGDRLKLKFSVNDDKLIFKIINTRKKKFTLFHLKILDDIQHMYEIDVDYPNAFKIRSHIFQHILESS